MHNLKKEMFEAAGRIKQIHLNNLRGLGVPSCCAALPPVELPFIGVCNAETDSGGRFQPGQGAAHYVQPVTEGGALVDLVAWRPLRPDAWAWRVGNGWLLGEIPEAGSWASSELLRVSATPLDWLRSGGEGVCILDYEHNSIKRLLDFPALIVDDNSFGRRLLSMLTKPSRVPELVVERKVRVA